MSIKHLLKIYLIGLFLFSSQACRKFLEEKSVKSLTVPEKLEDLDAILNNIYLNIGVIYPQVVTDELYLRTADWQSLYEPYANAYIWDTDLDINDDWVNLYQSIFYANTVLDNLEKIESGADVVHRNQIKGSALFYRAHYFYQLLQMFAEQYEASTASTKLGIPLRLNSDFNQPSVRASLQKSYDQIISDLNDASLLLNDEFKFKTKPSKIACHALLARTYLQMGDYTRANEEANSCLSLYSSLMDYNSSDIDSNSTAPFQRFNKEVIFYTTYSQPAFSARIDTLLYNSYDANDVRKKAFFGTNSDGSHFFKGSYNGSTSQLFSGISTDEVYLIRAETFARLGNTAASLQDLNTLLQKRWRGVFTQITANSATDALTKILTERRKELIYRGIRWADLKRLNKESQTAVTITRVLNGQTYILPPNDLRYAFLIPQVVVNNSKIQQNIR